MFSARCDNCQEAWCDGNGNIAYSDRSSMETALKESGWYFEDDPEKHYCADCWSIDGNDNLCLKEIENK